MRLDICSRTRGKEIPVRASESVPHRNAPALSAAVGSVTAVMVGTEETRLIVLRGNSASGHRQT